VLVDTTVQEKAITDSKLTREIINSLINYHLGYY